MPTADAIAATHISVTHDSLHACAPHACAHDAASDRTTVPSRRQIADAGRAGVVMGWARGTLTVATAAVLVLVVARVSLGRSIVDALNVTGQIEPFSSEVAGFTAAVLPGMLVAWCLGFAVAATSVGATWLGARVAGILAGGLGAAAGTALFVISR